MRNIDNRNGLFEENATFDENSSLSVHLSKGLTTFGDLRVANLTPVFGTDFVYVVNDRLFNTTLVGSATASIVNSQLELSTGTTPGSSVMVESIKRVRYRAGLGNIIRFTIVCTEGVDTAQQFIGMIDEDDGVGFGYNGAEFGILLRSSTSGSPVDTWYMQSTWNVDKCDGSDYMEALDWSKGQVCEIQFQYLGYGMLTFFMENPQTGSFSKVHTIKYANTATVPSLGNPTLPVCLYVTNGTTSDDIVMKSGSCCIFSDGPVTKAAPVVQAFSAEINATTTEQALFSIRSKTTFGAHTNHVETYIEKVTAAMSSSGNRNCVIRLVLNGTLSGASFADVGTNSSSLEYDTAATITAGSGTTIFSAALASNNSLFTDLIELGLFITAGDTLSVTAEMGSSTGTALVSLLVEEDQ